MERNSMKLFKKLALVTAVTAVSTGSFALESLSDKELAQKTGQDGITITISPDAEKGIQISKLLIHDNDGLDKTTTFKGAKATGFTASNELVGGSDTAGALAIYSDYVAPAGGTATGASAKKWDTTANNGSGGYVESGKGLVIQGGNIQVDVDTDGGKDSTATANNSFVNAKITMSGKTRIGIGKIGVATSNDTQTAYSGSDTRDTKQAVAKYNQILGALNIEMDGGSMNVQLGSQPQGAMVLMDSTVTGGLKLKNLEVVDSNGYSGAVPEYYATVPNANATTGIGTQTLTGDTSAGSSTTAAKLATLTATTSTAGKKGSLLIQEITLTDVNSKDLSLNASVDIDQNAGIVIKTNSPENGFYAYMKGVGIGDGDGNFAKYYQATSKVTTAAVAADPANNVAAVNEVTTFTYTPVESKIGDVELLGLDMGSSTISIKGH